MDPVVDQAICLRQWDYSETSQTAVLFGRNLGIVRVLGKGSKRNDPRFSGGLEVCTLGEAVVYPKESGLAVLGGWDLLKTYRGVRTSHASYCAAMLAIELPRLLLSEHEPHEPAWEGLAEALGTMAAESWHVVLARWQWGLLIEAGYGPDLGPADWVGFSPGLGRFVDAAAAADAGRVWAVHPTTREALLDLAAGRAVDPLLAVRAGRLLAWYDLELTGG
ncbi:MAG: recombination protein O N-terminal domain-containing protein [Planctomycetota bacterium]